MRVTVDELHVLGGKLDIDHTAGVELEITAASLVEAATELALDSIAHRANRLGYLLCVVRRPVHGLGSEPRNLGAERGIASDRPQLDQRLALPQARVVLVIAPPRRERRHQQALRARGSQSGVDLVEPTTRCAQAECAEQALR